MKNMQRVPNSKGEEGISIAQELSLESCGKVGECL